MEDRAFEAEVGSQEINPSKENPVCKRILFLQHAGGMGGSNMSLLFTLQALDRRRYEPIVGLLFPSAALRSFYEKAGFRVLDASGLSVFRHATAGWGRFSNPRSVVELLRNLWHWRRNRAAIEQLIEREKPDIMHLNSVILLPVARALMQVGFPFVWHVREAPVRGYAGLRFGYVRRSLRAAGDRVIFLSEADKRAWVDGSNGVVVHNFLDFDDFDRRASSFDGGELPPLRRGVPVLLYLGGFVLIKGVFPLLEALARLRSEGFAVEAIFPGTDRADPPKSHALRSVTRRIALGLGFKPEWQRCVQRIRELGLEDCVHRLPFTRNVPGLLSVSDCLVFPSVMPHFARPVIEAQAMGVPVVASRIDGVTELVEGSGSGCLVPPGDFHALAEAIQSIMNEKSHNPGQFEVTRQKARHRFDSRRQIRKIEALYERIATRFTPTLR